MKQAFLSTSVALALSLSADVRASGQEVEVAESETTRVVRKELAALPDYGVFDLLTFQVNEKGLVSLGGYVHQASLSGAAEKAVKRIDGVREVQNKIEVLPVSTVDDELRLELYREIYRESYASRHGTADSPLGASRPRFSPWGPGYRRQDPLRPPIWSGRPFPGTESLGDYAIHIIVRNGKVLLAGVVDSQADKTAAGLKASGVFGVRKVENELQVVSSTK